MYDDVLREKDSMVVKFAQQELKNTEYMKKNESLEARAREQAKEREMFISKLKQFSVDKSRLSAQLHNKVNRTNPIINYIKITILWIPDIKKMKI